MKNMIYRNVVRDETNVDAISTNVRDMNNACARENNVWNRECQRYMQTHVVVRDETNERNTFASCDRAIRMIREMREKTFCFRV